MPQCKLEHVSDPSVPTTCYDDCDAALAAVHSSGGHVVTMTPTLVRYSDWPRAQPAPLRGTLETPPLDIHLLTDKQ